MYNYLKLKTLAHSKGISNIDLANITGKSRVTIGKYMNGKSSPEIDILQKMADHLNVPITYFFLDDATLLKKASSDSDKGLNEVVRLQKALIDSYDRELKMLREFYDRYSENPTPSGK